MKKTFSLPNDGCKGLQQGGGGSHQTRHGKVLIVWKFGNGKGYLAAHRSRVVVVVRTKPV